MAYWVLVLILLLLSPARTLDAQAPASQGSDALEGGWVVVAAEQRGRPFDAIRGGGLVFEGERFYLKTAAGNELRGIVKRYPNTSPLQLDFVHDQGGVVWQAIYTVSEDTLRLNYVEAGERVTRPELFATSSDSSGTVVVLQRLQRAAP